MSERVVPIWRRRGVLFVAGAVALLLLVIAVVLPIVLDVERYRPAIEQALQDTTGWEPSLGSIDLAWFPFSVRVGESRLDSPRSESSVGIGSLDVAARLLPLFRGELAIEDITLDRPEIVLVRDAGASAWDIPAGGAAEPGDPPTAETPEEGGLIDVVVRRVRVRNGSLRIEDRSVSPPRVLDVEPFTTTLQPQSGRLDGQASLAPDGGTLSWAGTLERFTLTLESIATGRLATIVGSDLLAPGGTLSGQVELTQPLAVDGTLVAERLGFTTGAAPLERTELAFRVVADATGLLIESARLSLGQLHADARGRLTPSLDLELSIPESPLEPVLATLRGVAQFPLDVEGPGSAAANVVVRQDDTAELKYRATGSLSARRLIGAEFLPSVDDLVATFELAGADRLTVDVAEGRVAGGPMRGTVELRPVDPPGTLRFDGTLREASMGGLLAGFVQDAAAKIVGPTAVDASLTLDLDREVVDARAVGGAIRLSSGQVTLPGWDVEGRLERELLSSLDRLSLTSLLEKDKLAKLTSSDTPVAFDAMNARLSLDAIPWSLEGLRLSRDGGALTGAGRFDPLDGTVELDLDVALSAKRSARLAQKHRAARSLLDDDGQIRIPIGLAGALDRPGVEVDLGELLKLGLGSDDVQRDLVDKLKGLFDDDE